MTKGNHKQLFLTIQFGCIRTNIHSRYRVFELSMINIITL